MIAWQPPRRIVIPTLNAGKLEALVTDIFSRAGSAPAEARMIASRLVGSNLAGHDSHGVVRVSAYIGWLREGKIAPNAHARIINESETFAILDGGSGYGQVIGSEAMEVGIAKARRTGLALIGLRHAHHIGRIGDWAEQCAAAGMASIHFVNVVHYGGIVAPFGGAERRFSTNPIACGMPRPGQDPIILDFATSEVAEGKVMVARNKGVPLPEGALLDARGTPSVTPADLYGPPEGMLLAFGRHKGSGLAIFADLFAGALAGGGCNHDGQPNLQQVHNNMLSVIIDVERIAGREAAEREVAAFVRWVRSARPRTPGGEVLMPGEPELRSREARLRDGIPIDEATWAALAAAAAGLGINALPA
jgi:uncharacterized oxidoreductase